MQDQVNHIQCPEQDAKTRILHVAAKLFAQKGFAGTSIREIARAAQVTNPVIYYHFRSKRGLFQEIISQTINSSLQAIDAVTEQVCQPAEQIAGIVRSLCSYGVAHINTLQMIHRELVGVGKDDSIYRMVAEYKKQLFSRIGVIIQRGITAGQFRTVDPKAASLALLGSVNAVVVWDTFPPSEVATEPSIEKPAEELVSVLLHGLMARGD